jgi:3alpha(or 20beta)-hydroxysteroid dehydrogenase
MKRLDGKVALVTGGARGIGEGIVRRFVKEGARVLVTDIRAEEGETLASELDEAAQFHEHDVTSRKQWDGAIVAAEKSFGRLDILVNNAGILMFRGFEDYSAEDIEKLIDVNLKGVINGCQAAIPAIERAGGGAIVNMSSIDGILGANSVSIYCATKFAVRGLTKALALELGPRRIRVNSIHPGGIFTPLANPQNVSKAEYDERYKIYPAQYAGEPKDIAAAAAYLASEDARYCMGAEIVVDGGMNAGHYYAGLPGAPM